jgi:hypothetical protein
VSSLLGSDSVVDFQLIGLCGIRWESTNNLRRRRDGPLPPILITNQRFSSPPKRAIGQAVRALWMGATGLSLVSEQ